MPPVQRSLGRRRGRGVGALAAAAASNVASSLEHLGSSSTGHATSGDALPSYSSLSNNSPSYSPSRDQSPDDGLPSYAASTSVTSASAASAASADPLPGYTAVPEGGLDPRKLTEFQLDELVHRIIGRITRLVRAELRMDRERIGRLRDPRP